MRAAGVWALALCGAVRTGRCLRLEASSAPAGDGPVPASIVAFERPLRRGAGRGSEYLPEPGLAELYLSTLRDTLTGSALKTPGVSPGRQGAVQVTPFEDAERDEGRGWCDFCYTMAGNARLSHVRRLLERCAAEAVPGDFVEAGVWRGGTSIFARAVQRAAGEGAARRVYACDSFAGVPRASAGPDSDWFHGEAFLAVPLEEVRDHFERFQMLDQNVVFVRGYFQDSLPLLRERLRGEGRSVAVLRGDGDLHESYYDILYNLYDLVPVGGYFVCDDCPNVLLAHAAVHQFRARHGIAEPMEPVPGSSSGMFWRKARQVSVDYAYYLQWNETRRRG